MHSAVLTFDLKTRIKFKIFRRPRSFKGHQSLHTPVLAALIIVAKIKKGE